MLEAPMKKIMITLGLAVSLLGLSGCAKKATIKRPVATQTNTPQKRSPHFSAAPKTSETKTPTKSDGKFSPLFFTYDESTLSGAAMLKLDEIALFLDENPAATLLVLGHADERGTEEYNLALGQERAESIKQYLTYMRIDPTRISTVSYGEEIPFAEGLDEESLAKNRRGEFEVNGVEKIFVINEKSINRPALRSSLSPKLLQLGKLK
jgi:peptidoglycan-associated lipoprotein